MTQDTIDRLALGTPIGLGYLYNACEEKPCNVSILTEYPPPPRCVNIIETRNTQSDFVLEKSMSDKFSRLNVAAELKLSLCAGLISVRGSGEYFKEAKDSERAVSCSLVHKITTAHESLNILDKNLRDVINLDALKHRGATHVVTGVTWGANLIVTMKHQNSEKKDEQKIAGSLQVELKKFSIDLEGSASLDFQDRDNKEISKFTLKISGDVVAPGPFPTTIQAGMRLLEQLPSLVKESNGGRGVPIRYDMISLEAIQSYFGFNVKIESVLRAIQDETILRIVTTFDSVNDAKQKLNDLCTDVKKYEDHLPQHMISEVIQLRDEAAVAESNFKRKLQKLLIEVRSCDADSSVLDNLRAEYDSSPYSPLKVLQKLHNNFRAVKAKMKLMSSLGKLDVIIVAGHTEALSSKLLEFTGKKVYVLFGESKAIEENRREWDGHLTKFRQLKDDPAASDNLKFMYVDLDAAMHLQPQTGDGQQRKILIQRFDEYGQCEESDVINEKEKEPPRWVPAANGDVPRNAVEGGRNKGEVLYVARAWYDNNLVPGKLHRSHGCCYIPYGHDEHKVSRYEVLVAQPGTVQWVASQNGENVKNAIEGGYKPSGEPYHVGRCGHDGEIIPGKVQLDNQGCYIPYDGDEIKYSSYEILVLKR